MLFFLDRVCLIDVATHMAQMLQTCQNNPLAVSKIAIPEIDVELLTLHITVCTQAQQK